MYKGWSNKETWCVWFWIERDKLSSWSHLHTMELEELAQFLEDEHFAALPELPSGYPLSLLNAAFERVDWVELAERIKARVAHSVRAATL